MEFVLELQELEAVDTDFAAHSGINQVWELLGRFTHVHLVHYIPPQTSQRSSAVGHVV